VPVRPLLRVMLHARLLYHRACHRGLFSSSLKSSLVAGRGAEIAPHPVLFPRVEVYGTPHARTNRATSSVQRLTDTSRPRPPIGVQEANRIHKTGVTAYRRSTGLTAQYCLPFGVRCTAQRPGNGGLRPVHHLSARSSVGRRPLAIHTPHRSAAGRDSSGPDKCASSPGIGSASRGHRSALGQRPGSDPYSTRRDRHRFW
jgi:hypothetical protein